MGFESLAATFGDVWPMLMSGLATTLQVTIISLVIAMFVGILVCLMHISRFKVLSGIAKFYIWIIRGTPMLVQAFYLYFAMPQPIQYMGYSDFRINVVTASILTLTLNAGAYISEIFRGTIEAVPAGQMGASRSLGVSYATSMHKIILPQAVRICLPTLVNQCITIKDSTILYAIGLGEIMYQARIYVGRTMESFATYTWVAVVFLLITSVLMLVSHTIEKRMHV